PKGRAAKLETVNNELQVRDFRWDSQSEIGALAADEAAKLWSVMQAPARRHRCLQNGARFSLACLLRFFLPAPCLVRPHTTKIPKVRLRFTCPEQTRFGWPPACRFSHRSFRSRHARPGSKAQTDTEEWR